MKTKQLQIRMGEEDFQKLSKIAQKEHFPAVSSFARKVLLDFLARIKKD